MRRVGGKRVGDARWPSVSAASVWALAMGGVSSWDRAHARGVHASDAGFSVLRKLATCRIALLP